MHQLVRATWPILFTQYQQTEPSIVTKLQPQEMEEEFFANLYNPRLFTIMQCRKLLRLIVCQHKIFSNKLFATLFPIPPCNTRSSGFEKYHNKRNVCDVRYSVEGRVGGRQEMGGSLSQFIMCFWSGNQAEGERRDGGGWLKISFVHDFVILFRKMEPKAYPD